MSEYKSSEPLPLSKKPDEACHATQEALLGIPGVEHVMMDCPICADFGTRCRVGSHPTAASSGICGYTFSQLYITLSSFLPLVAPLMYLFSDSSRIRRYRYDGDTVSFWKTCMRQFGSVYAVLISMPCVAFAPISNLSILIHFKPYLCFLSFPR